MDELALQKLLVDVVRKNGGAADKLSHRFLVGVPDLLVKLPGAPAGLLEVKQHTWNKIKPAKIKLAVTKLQEVMLKRYDDAGMPTGVVSFLQQRGKGTQELQICVLTLTEVRRVQYKVRTASHTFCGTNRDVIMQQLTGWHNACQHDRQQTGRSCHGGI